MSLETVKPYQIDNVIADSEGSLATDSTLAALKTYLLTGKTYQCPQCAGVGTIDADFDGENDTECPTCEGYGKTEVQYVIDRENSTINFKVAE